VIVIGAGAAGLTAAYDLKRHNKDMQVQILEAHNENNNMFGGRIRKLSNFADFPIDLGAEWIHGNPNRILKDIVDTKDEEINDKLRRINTKQYQFAPFHEWRKRQGWVVTVSVEYEYLWKFVNSTWHDFFGEYIVSTLPQDAIHYGCVVKAIDYGADSNNNIVKVTCQDGRTFCANQVICTVSLSVLQQEKIQFHPPLPVKKQRAIANATFEPGFKAFLEFSECFYHKNFNVHKKHKRSHGEMYFYDQSALHSNKHQHVLAVFAYGDMAKTYVSMNDDDILQTLLQELDEAYQGKATQYYIKGVVMNWSAEPHVGGNYSSFRRGMAPMFTLHQPLDSKVFFAGEHVPPGGSEYGFVHTAALSGRAAAKAVVCVQEGKKQPFPWRMWCISNVLGTLCCGLEQWLFFRDLDYMDWAYFIAKIVRK